MARKKDSDAPKKMGRPSKYTPELGQEIRRRLCSGDSLRKIIKEPGMPTYSTVMYWLQPPHPKESDERKADYAHFSELYVEGRRGLAMYYADQIVDLADDSDADSYLDDEGKPVWNTEHLLRTRLRIDTRKWLAAKYYPRFFGENSKQEVAVTGAVGFTVNIGVRNDRDTIELAPEATLGIDE